MEAEKANYPVQRMARLLGSLPVWVLRLASTSPCGLFGAVRSKGGAGREGPKAHADSFGICGAPRIRAALARNGTGVDRKTVASSMRRQGLEGISPRPFGL